MKKTRIFVGITGASGHRYAEALIKGYVAAGGAVVVNDGEQLESFVWHCLRDPAYAASVGQRARRFVATQLGATERTVALLNDLLPSDAAATRRNAA